MTSQNNLEPKSGRQQKWIEGEDYIKNNQKNISERNSKKLKKFDNRSFLEPSNKQAVTNPDKPVAPPGSASSKQSPAHGGGFGGLESN